MNKSTPFFSVILPVRNGGKYLHLCVESILLQSYKNFDLVILENQSTDGTAEWLKKLEKKDSRVKVLPSESSLSIEDNWGRILKVSKYKYMTIIGHDDILDSSFLETIYALINRYPEANLYQTHFRFIDANGKEVRKCSPMKLKQNAKDFLSDIFNFRIDSYGTGYVMRSALYEKLGGIPRFNKLMFADHALWLMLTEFSWKATAKEECFSYRIHENSTSSSSSGLASIEGLQQFKKKLLRYGEGFNTLDERLNYEFNEYVFSIHRTIYFKYFYDANKENITVNKCIRKSIVSSLEKFNPELVKRFNMSVLVRLLEISNKKPFRKSFLVFWPLYRTVRNFIK